MFFSKQKANPDESVLSDILDSQDIDIVITSGKDCKVLLMNAAAKSHLDGGMSVLNCRNGYSYLFPDLCRNCPNEHPEDREGPVTYEVQDEEGRYFSVRYNSIKWLDGKPATIMFLRDINEERTAKEKLYNLAYIDQLTGVPNRQKLKEDFEAIVKKIANTELVGVLTIFDLDNFKAINDTYGHSTGDVMLKRLTDHLEGDSAFKDHLYRLGGDEFVLFYAEPSEKFTTQVECYTYYKNLLQGALLSYTMPNIEASCTISMGVAFFPWHGETFSELLRKADIALYKAKGAGRNQIAYFEDHYDTAKKFKDLYINIQPILLDDGRTYGYELVDQSNDGKEDDDSLNLNEFDRTMEALGLDDLESDTLYFISYSNQLLNQSVMRNLPKNKFIIQIRLTDECTDKDLERYKKLRTFGYSLALAGLNKLNAIPQLVSLAYYCKFDPREKDEVFRRNLIAQHPSKKFIATNVDTAAQFETAKGQGYALYQGFFFNRPNIIKKTKQIDPLRVNYLRLLKLTSTEDYVDFQEISAVIASDVALTYKLLRLLNSAAVGLRNPISSIPMAVAYLGEVSLKKWIAMLALRGVASDKPLELIRLSLIRAQFGEHLAPLCRPRRNAKHVFLLGLLSLLDIALEKTKEEVFEEITVADEIRDSLLTPEGPYSDMVRFFANYEYANWDEVAAFATKNGLTDRQINNAYIAAVKWYNDLLNVKE